MFGFYDNKKYKTFKSNELVVMTRIWVERKNLTYLLYSFLDVIPHQQPEYFLCGCEST